MANFTPILSGRRKIARGEFVIQDAGSKKLIDLAGDWNTCFAPGQRVEMSIVFKVRKATNPSCPGCRAAYATSKDVSDTVDYLACGMSFCNKAPNCVKESARVSRPSLEESICDHTRNGNPKCESTEAEIYKYEFGDDPTVYRRVRILELLEEPSDSGIWGAQRAKALQDFEDLGKRIGAGKTQRKTDKRKNRSYIEAHVKAHIRAYVGAYTGDHVEAYIGDHIAFDEHEFMEQSNQPTAYYGKQ